MDTNEIDKLANLARIDIKDSDKKKLSEDVESVLSYVGKVKEIAGGAELTVGDHRNVMREDGKPHEGGVHSKKLIEQFPQRDGNYLEVKKIIDQDL